MRVKMRPRYRGGTRLSRPEFVDQPWLCGSKCHLRTPLDAGSTKELQQVALAVVDPIDERVI
jgi:hypothetical protein